MANTVDTSGYEAHVAAWQSQFFVGLQRFAKALQLTLARRATAKAPNKTGKLAEALQPGGKGNISEITTTSGNLEITSGISSDLIPYATIQDTGGTIQPRNAKALAIPISEEARQAYVSAGGDLRSLDLFVLKTNTNAFLAKKGTGEPLFVLKPSVTLKGSHFFSDSIEELQAADIPALLEEAATDLATIWNSI